MEKQTFLEMAWSYTRVLVLVLGTLSAAAIAAWSAVQGMVGWQHVTLFMVAALWIRVSITLYNHRYFTHGAYQFTPLGAYTLKPLLLFGSGMAVQGSTEMWRGAHLKHHQYVDDWSQDPHSPNAPGGLLSKMWGFLWAHIFWMVYLKSVSKPVPSSQPRGWLEKIYGYDLTYILFGPILAGSIAWLLIGWLGVAWYFAAVCVTLHVTWGVNSVGHMWGSRPFPTKDCSRDSWLFVLLSPEYFHNAHHAFGSSARFVHKTWQLLFDPEYLLLVACLRLGPLSLVRDIKVPSAEHVRRRRQTLV